MRLLPFIIQKWFSCMLIASRFPDCFPLINLTPFFNTNNCDLIWNSYLLTDWQREISFLWWLWLGKFCHKTFIIAEFLISDCHDIKWLWVWSCSFTDFRFCSHPCTSLLPRKASCHVVVCSGICLTLHWSAESEHFLYWGLVLNLLSWCKNITESCNQTWSRSFLIFSL